MGEIPTFLRNEVEERKAKGIKAKCHDEPLFDAEKSQTALKYLQYQEREKKNQPFSQLTKTLSYIKFKKKNKLKEKFHTRKMPFKNIFLFKKQMYGQMSLKTLQISFYFKYIWTFSRFNLH